MNRREVVDCFEFYLWTVGELQLSEEPGLNELVSNKEDQ